MNKQHKAQLIEVCTKEFFLHPNWEQCLELFETFIDDLTDVNSIDTKGKNSDEIATELKARQITHARIKRWVDETLMVKKMKDENVPTKTRKFK